MFPLSNSVGSETEQATQTLTIEKPSLEQLDQILSKAGSLDGFLADKEIQADYFDGLKRYLELEDAKFDQKTIDAFLSQLKSASETIPGFKERIWESTGLGHRHSLELDVQFVDSAKLKNHFQVWRKNIESVASRGEELGFEAAQQHLNRLGAKVDAEIKSAEGKGRKLRERAQGQVIRQIKSDQAAVSAVAQLLKREITSGDEARLVACPTALCVEEVIRNLRERVMTSAGASSAVSPLIDQLDFRAEKFAERGGAVLKPSQVQAYSTIGEQFVRGKMEFKPAPRRFHTIFKGVKLNECVGGCSVNLESLTPERWATALLKDTEFYFIESKGSYRGAVQLVPLKEVKTGKVYASVDTMSGLFSNEVLVRGKDGAIESDTFFQAWLRKYLAGKPKSWSGVMLGQSHSVDSYASPAVIRSSSGYLFGRPVGTSVNFHFLDSDFVAKLTQLVPRKTWQQVRYGGEMIFDAGVRGSGELRVVNVGIPQREAFNIQRLKKALDLGSDDFIPTLLKFIDSLPATPRHEQLINEALAAMTQNQRNKFLDEFSMQIAAGNFYRNSERLAKFKISQEEYERMLAGIKLKDVAEGGGESILARFRSYSYRLLISSRPSWDYAKVQIISGLPVDAEAAVRDHFMTNELKSLSDFDRYVNEARRPGSDSHKRSMIFRFEESFKRLMREHYGAEVSSVSTLNDLSKRYSNELAKVYLYSFRDEIAANAASIQDLIPFRKASFYVRSELAFQERALFLAKTPLEFVLASRLNTDSSTLEYRQGHGELVIKHIDRFFSSGAQLEEVRRLLDGQISREAAKALLESAVEHRILKTHADLIYALAHPQFFARHENAGAIFSEMILRHPELTPNEKELTPALQKMKLVAEDVSLRKQFLERSGATPSKSSILKALKYGEKASSVAWQNSMASLYQEYVPVFFSQNPSNREIRRLKWKIQTLAELREIARGVFSVANSADDFILAADARRYIDSPSRESFQLLEELAVENVDRFLAMRSPPTPKTLATFARLAGAQNEQMILKRAALVMPNSGNSFHRFCSSVFKAIGVGTKVVGN